MIIQGGKLAAVGAIMVLGAGRKGGWGGVGRAGGPARGWGERNARPSVGLVGCWAGRGHGVWAVQGLISPRRRKQQGLGVASNMYTFFL